MPQKGFEPTTNTRSLVATGARVIHHSDAVDPKEWRSATKNDIGRPHAHPENLVPQTSGRRKAARQAKLEQQLRAEIDRDLAPRRSNIARFETTNQSSYVKPSGFGQIGRRVMKNRDGTPALGYDAATYEFGLHDKPSSLTEKELIAQMSNESFETDMPVSYYTQAMMQGSIPSSASTSAKNVFGRSSKFTNDIKDPTSRTMENSNDKSGALKLPGADLALQALLARIRKQIVQRNGNQGIKNLGRLFRILDDNQNKRLSMSELSMFREMGVQLSHQEAQMIFAHFDTDGTGSINFDEFLYALSKDMSTARRRIVEEAYNKLDKDGSGQVTRADIEQAYDVSQNPEVISGKITPDQAFTQFMAQWETDKADGIITLSEFMSYYQKVSASIDRDDYFNLVIRNAWHLGDATTVRRVLLTFKNGTQKSQAVPDDLGLGPREFDKIRARLHRMGVHNVVKIENADGSFKSWKVE